MRQPTEPEPTPLRRWTLPDGAQITLPASLSKGEGVNRLRHLGRLPAGGDGGVVRLTEMPDGGYVLLSITDAERMDY